MSGDASFFCNFSKETINMEQHQKSADEVCRALMATLSPDREQRRQAEAFLSHTETTPGFAVLLLQLVRQHSRVEGNNESKLIRASGAVYFKNVVKRGWVGSENEKLVLSPEEKTAVKKDMVAAVCETARQADVREQLCAALTLMSKSDFPAHWLDLLDQILRQFESNDLQILTGMLLTLDSILKRFRDVEATDALHTELKYVLDNLCVPLTSLFLRLGNLEDEYALVPLRLVCRIFYSLNWQTIPEFFEDNMDKWMPEFEKYLGRDRKAGVEDDDEEGPLERLQAAVVENVSLYAAKYEEEFAPYLSRFASAIWTRLMKSRNDRLVVTSIKFLSSVLGNAVHSSNFAEENTLRQITSAIVVPNLKLRESDLELFEDNPVEYISRDFEAADSETRRRSARELVQAMCKQHEAVATRLCLEHVGALLAEYSASPAKNWTAKDTALHLVVAVAVRTESRARGVTALSRDVDVVDFFGAHVRPELLPTAQQNQHPVILADCIQFTSTFRNQLVTVVPDLVPLLAHHARSKVKVVHTYAAAALERLLATGKIPKNLLEPHLIQIFESLFTVLEPGGASANNNDWENEYAMRTVMRLLMMAEGSITPVAQIVTDKLMAALSRVCANPRNPRFNHYLFESLAVLVRAVGPDHADQFETLVFPPFQQVLQNEVVEFSPYVFQILALLLTFRTAPSQSYVALLGPLSNAQLWERRGNVPALTQLLEAYFAVGPRVVVEQNQLEPILGVFQKLLASKQYEFYAFALVTAVVSNVELAHVEKYLVTIVQLLLTRLTQHRDRVALIHHVVSFFGLVAARHSPTLLVATLDQIQAGMLVNLATHVFAPTLLSSPTFNSPADAKKAVVGLTRILCETPEAVGATAQNSSSGGSTDNNVVNPWVATLAAVLAIVSANTAVVATAPRTALDDDLNLDDAQVGYDAAFSQLHFGTNKTPKDVFPHVPDLGAYVTNSVNQLCLAKPQPFQQLAQNAQAYRRSHPPK